MATNLVYTKLGTAISFKDSGGSAVITLQNLAAVTGRKSALYDRGAGLSYPERYLVTAFFQFETAPIAAETVDLFLCQSDGTYIDGNMAAGDEAFTVVQKPNLRFIGSVYVQTNGADVNNIQRFEVTIQDRYFAVAVWNASAGDNLQNTANTCGVIFTPLIDEIQASA